MLVYPHQTAVPVSDLTPFQGNPADIGGEILEGEPRIFLRIDHQEGGASAGIFHATTAKVRITFPFTEHATILDGEVIITDASGRSHTYKPGDSYFIRQGEVVIWDVRGPAVQKAFFNVRQG